MDSWRQASSLEAPACSPARRLQRRRYRHQIHCLAYLNLDQANGGILRNLGDAGIAVQAVAPLSVDQQVFLRFDLSNPRVRVEGTGRVAWADPVGQAGIEFLALPQRSKRGLKEWIFIQLLTAAQQATGDSTFVDGMSGEADALLFSSAPRPAIRLAAARAAPLAPHQKNDGEKNDGENDKRGRTVHLPWLPFSISGAALSRLVDGLILLSALLLFAVISMAMIGAVPAWPIALLLGLGVTSVFTIVYRFLFLFWIGGTPGNYLTQLTSDALKGMNLEADERPRFR
jgi:PilZ domain-containing protein